MLSCFYSACYLPLSELLNILGLPQKLSQYQKKAQSIGVPEMAIHVIEKAISSFLNLRRRVVGSLSAAHLSVPHRALCFKVVGQRRAWVHAGRIQLRCSLDSLNIGVNVVQ